VPKDDPRDDGALIAAINRGDPAAFEALYYRYRDWVARLARRFTGNEADALDVLQDTFAYLLTKFPGFRLTARMTTFLYPVVKHLALAALSKGRYRRDRSDRSSESNQSNGSNQSSPRGNLPLDQLPAPPAEDPAASRSELAAVMAALPEAQREAVLMRFVDDMTLVEIAEALDIPVGTVKSRLHNALQTLRHDPRTRRHFRQE
jgi:RNA polymerase sigma-70 factor (ECF subfamily)